MLPFLRLLPPFPIDLKALCRPQPFAQAQPSESFESLMANHQYGPGQESALVLHTFHVTCSASLALFSSTLCHLESILKRPGLVAYRHHCARLRDMKLFHESPEENLWSLSYSYSLSFGDDVSKWHSCLTHDDRMICSPENRG